MPTTDKLVILLYLECLLSLLNSKEYFKKLFEY